jgi:hypothetical protein
VRSWLRTTCNGCGKNTKAQQPHDPLQVLRGCRGHEFRAFAGLTPTRYVEVRRRFLREHAGHALDGWPLPAD